MNVRATQAGGVVFGALALAGACAVSFPETDYHVTNGTSTGGGASTSSSGGGCIPACGGGLACCNGACAVTSVDANNCGACGVVCATSGVCDGSMCRCGAAGPLCSAGSTCCGATCTDLATDAANCGACGKACAANETCSGSQCLCGGAPCAAGNTCCGGAVCSNLALDSANCGACGMACPVGDTCSVNGCSDWADWPMPNPVITGLPHPASYTSMTGYVRDNVTGLSWQQPIDVNDAQAMNCAGGCSQAAAIAYCKNLTLAGKSDWRLPTRIELVSIVDSTVSKPSTNGTAFPGTPGVGFWTSSPFNGGGTYYVDFTDGYTNVSFSLSDAHSVRCVR